MKITKPSTLTLANGSKCVLLNAKSINGRNFGLVAEIPDGTKNNCFMGVVELHVIDGQAHLEFYNGPNSADLAKHILS